MNHTINSTPPYESVLRTLRSLMPTRALTYAEALQRAELQASRLLELHQVSHGPVPIEVVTELPRVRAVRITDMPTSGSAHWDGAAWVLTINASESDTRQRFSLMHEFKHVLDHPIRDLIRGNGRMPAAEIAEKVADYFAACALMPKSWVKQAWYSGIQSVERLAGDFDVSPMAMRYRLDQLGLSEAPRRCHGRSVVASPRWLSRTYFRSLPIQSGVLQ